MGKKRQSKSTGTANAHRTQAWGDLILLSRYLQPADTKFSSVRKVYNPGAAQLASCVADLGREGYLRSDGALSEKGTSRVDALLPAVFDGQSPSACYQAFAGARLLDVEIDASNFDIVRDVRIVTAALVIRVKRPSFAISHLHRKSIVMFAARQVIVDLLLKSSIQVHPAESAFPKTLDPMLVDLFEVATGTRVIDQGLQAAIYDSFIRGTDARWRKLTSMSFDSMIAKPRKQPASAAPEQLVARVSKALSSILSGRWMLISQAFEAYREIERVSLQDFKDALGVIAMSEQIELSPIDVPQMYAADARTKSATVLGGLTFHLVRLRT